MSLAVVTTTINVPELFEGYCKDFRAHNRREVYFIIVGDRKTPAEVSTYCQLLEHTYGYPFEYFDVERQKSFLSAFPDLDHYLPYDSVQRRNIGLLWAYQRGYDVVLTVDDDNYLLEPDLLRHHLSVGTTGQERSFVSSSGWFNPCQFLNSNPALPFYHRGFPLKERWKITEVQTGVRAGRVVVNVGMWLGDPDVDAWLRLSTPLESVHWNQPDNFVLGQNTWAPFNSQQTAIARDLIPAYFLNPNAGRYDDIWASFIIHRLANHFGDLVSYGSPIVSHVQTRSVASLWRDLDEERMGALLTEEFVEIVRSVPLAARSYAACYAELAQALASTLQARTSRVKGGIEFLQEYVRGMQLWQKTLESLDSSVPILASADAAHLTV
jgi:hypothetical protein